TIKDLVDNGTLVNEGDWVMTLDFSGLEEQKKDKLKDVNSAYALKIQAEQAVETQKLENDNLILKAKNALDLANIDVVKYRDGDYPQAEKTAKSDFDSWDERSSWSRRMVKKGMLSKVQADADQDRRDAAELALKALKYTKERTEKDLDAKVKEAKNTLDKT